jgi:putative IMPACT (imprinted ancient) family translation regulator
MPVLNAIRMSGITAVCVVVTRYFGGILLGAGGLVRAYSTSASMALDAGGTSVFESFAELECVCSYSDYQKLQILLASYEAKIDTTEFLTEVVVKFAIPEDELDKFNKNLTETFAARFDAKKLGTRFDTK